MSVAQQLYEMGLITYHRTDSLNLSDQSLAEARDYINSTFGANYWAGNFKRFKTKTKLAQEAHEAIRPSDPARTIERAKNEKSLSAAQVKLYELIWQRFIASQMAPAVFDSATVDIEAKKNYIFRATGQTLKFDGF